MGFIVIIVIFIILAMVVLIIASFWKLFEKAGKPGWAAIVPIYNTIVMIEIAKKPVWWIVLMLIPYVGIIWSIWVLNLFVKAFGKSEGYTIGILFLPFIFLPMLAFSDDTEYIGGEEEDFFGDEEDETV